MDTAVFDMQAVEGAAVESSSIGNGAAALSEGAQINGQPAGPMRAKRRRKAPVFDSPETEIIAA